MEYNLKNRPKLKITEQYSNMYAADIAFFDNWFEGFEKELREWLANIGEYSFTACALKEILGE